MADRPTRSIVVGVGVLTVVGLAALVAGPVTAVVTGLVLGVGGLTVGRFNRDPDVRLLAVAAMGTGAAVLVAGIAFGVLVDRADKPVPIGPSTGFERSTTTTTAGPPAP